MPKIFKSKLDKCVDRAKKNNPTLTCIDLEGKNIGDAGAAKLASALADNTHVKALRLPNNGIGPKGAKSLASMLRQNSSLTWLSLRKNKIGDEGATSLASALRHDCTLTIVDTFDNNISRDLSRKIDRLVETNGAGPVKAARQKKMNRLLEINGVGPVKATTRRKDAECNDDPPMGQHRRPFPLAFRCCLTLQVMQDPVIDPEGTSYERRAILDWFIKNGNISPNTGNPLTAEQLYENRALKAVIIRETLLSEESLKGSLRRFNAKIRSGWTRLADRLPLGTSCHHPLPGAFYCPITQELIHVPVIDPDGHTYERDAITQWLNSNGKSPVTRSPLRVDQLYPNVALEDLLDDERGRTDESIHPSVRRWKLSTEAKESSSSAVQPSPQEASSAPPADIGEEETSSLGILIFCSVLAVLLFIGSAIVNTPYLEHCIFRFVLVSAICCEWARAMPRTARESIERLQRGLQYLLF